MIDVLTNIFKWIVIVLAFLVGIFGLGMCMAIIEDLFKDAFKK